MRLTHDHKRKLAELFPEKVQQLLALEDVNQLLDFLDMNSYILMEDEDELTDNSRDVELLRNSIYWYNKHTI